MIERGDYRQIRDALLAGALPVGRETVPLEDAAGRILAGDIAAVEDVPGFDRSPYDGYAFLARDTQEASPEKPVRLRVVDYIAAGDLPHTSLQPGEAARLMTGAPVPEGADAVLPFEKTVFARNTVEIREPAAAGSNIVRRGEDVRKGAILCRGGDEIDVGLAGTLAGQGIFRPEVFRVPVIGVLSTGSELLGDREIPVPGRIYNTNRYSLQAACAQAGCRSLYLGTAGDDAGEISALLRGGLEECDAVLLSGGVSVGDYDCTPAAMEEAGVEILARGAALKPGMAGAYGFFRGREGKDIPVFALSGNPAACMTAFYAIALPVLRKLGGRGRYLPASLKVELEQGYGRKIPSARLLRGRVDFSAVTQKITIADGQGNQKLSTLAGCNAFAEIPAGETVEAGGHAEAFLIGS